MAGQITADVPEEIANVIETWSDYLYNLPNVLLVGYGRKITNGSIVESRQNCIVIHVSRKTNNLDPDQRIPPMLDGIPTDVVDTGGGIQPA